MTEKAQNLSASQKLTEPEMPYSHSQRTKHDSVPNFGPWQFLSCVPVASSLEPVTTATKTQDDGWRPMTAYKRNAQRSKIAMLGTNTWRGSGYTVQNVNCPPVNLMWTRNRPTWFQEDILNDLKIAARLKVKDQQVNVALMLAGANQTASTIYEHLSIAYQGIRDMRRGRPDLAYRRLRRYAPNPSWSDKALRAYRAARKNVKRYAPQLEKAASDLWLSLNFCYMQLYSDAKGGMEELSRETKLGFIHGRSGRAHEFVDQWTDSYYTYTWSQIGWVSHTQSGRFVKYVQLSYKLDDAFLANAGRLGLTNPFAVAHDLMPWSWVVDWVWPLGKYWNALDATIGLTFKGGHYGARIDVSQHSRVGPAPNGTSSTEGVIEGFGAVNDFSRTLVSDSIMPPSLRNPLTGIGWKIATIAALIGQQGGFTKRPKAR